MKLSIVKVNLPKRWFMIRLEPEINNDQMILERIEDKLGAKDMKGCSTHPLSDKNGKFLRLEIYI